LRYITAIVSASSPNRQLLSLSPSQPFRLLKISKVPKRTISLVNIRPRIFPPHHILHFFPLHLFPLEIGAVDEELVGAGAAFEAVLPGGVVGGEGAAGDGQGVGAAGTDWGWCQ